MAGGESILDDLPRGLSQRVLPATVRIDAVPSSDFLPQPELIAKHQYEAMEYHDIADLPDVNIFFTGQKEKYFPITREIFAKMRQYVQFLGLTKEELKPLRIYLDPDSMAYKSATAMYDYKFNILRVIINKLGLDHELAHWVSLGIFNADNVPASNLLVEGFAGWTAWFTKSQEEQHRASGTVDDYRAQMKALKQKANVGPPTLALMERAINVLLHKPQKPNRLGLNDNYNAKSGRLAGGYLFEILFEACGQDAKKLFNWWRQVNQYEKVADWIAACGLNPAQIEEQWNQRIAAEEPAS